MIEIDAAEVARRCSPLQAVDALEAALRDGFDPEAATPRTFLDAPGGELLVMPGVVGDSIAVKLVTVGGEPRIQGVVVVFDPETLAPAALIDGIALTNLRTSAVSALAVRHLATQEARRLLVFGRGAQGPAHVEAVRAVRPSIDHVDVVGREHPDDIDDLVARADVICCCTTASEPLFDGAIVADHATVVAVGSHDPALRETDDTLARRAGTVVVESRASAVREGGDVLAALRSGALAEDELVTLAELVRGRVEPSASAPRFFKSVGMAWEDAVVAGQTVKNSR